MVISHWVKYLNIHSPKDKHSTGNEGKKSIETFNSLLLRFLSSTAMNRMNNEEKRMLDMTQIEIYRELRQAAECHRQTRKWVMSWIEPGMKMIDIW
jgi:hypothetical protein